MREKRQNYSIPRASKILGITKQGLYNLVDDDHVQARKILGSNGSVLKIDRAEMLRLLRRKRKGEPMRKYLREIDRS